MKPKQIFWGVLFLFLGAFLLLNNLYDFTLSLPQLTKTWPIVLILIGVSIILKNNTTKVILAALSGILIASIIFSIFSRSFSWFHGKKHKHTYTVEKYDIPFDSNVRVMMLKFDSGVGEFNFSHSDSDNSLLKINSSGYGSNFSVRHETINDSVFAKVELEDIDIDLNDDDNAHFENDIALHKNLVYDLRLNVGAARVDCELDSIKVRSLKIKTGASDVSLSLGDLYADDVNLDISAGAAAVKISVPQSVGVQVRTDLSLSSYDFEDMKEVGEEKFRTENFDEAEKKIFIKIDGGMSSVHIKRK